MCVISPGQLRKTFFFPFDCRDALQNPELNTGVWKEKHAGTRFSALGADSTWKITPRVCVSCVSFFFFVFWACVGSPGQTYRSARCWRCAARRSQTEDCGFSPAATPPAASTSPESGGTESGFEHKGACCSIKKTSTTKAAFTNDLLARVSLGSV